MCSLTETRTQNLCESRFTAAQIEFQEFLILFCETETKYAKLNIIIHSYKALYRNQQLGQEPLTEFCNSIYGDLQHSMSSGKLPPSCQGGAGSSSASSSSHSHPSPSVAGASGILADSTGWLFFGQCFSYVKAIICARLCQPVCRLAVRMVLEVSMYCHYTLTAIQHQVCFYVCFEARLKLLMFCYY